MQDEHFKSRVKEIATAIVIGMIERGEIPKTDEAILAAFPEAVDTARAALCAAEEFLCG